MRALPALDRHLPGQDLALGAMHEPFAGGPAVEHGATQALGLRLVISWFLHGFSEESHRPMSDDHERTLHPATAAELKETLSYALRYTGKKRMHSADDVMARVTAERLVQHLEQSGFVLMRRLPANAPSISGHRHPNSD